MIPDQLRKAWEAVIKTKFEDLVTYTAFTVERDKYLGKRKGDPLEECKVVVALSHTPDGE